MSSPDKEKMNAKTMEFLDFVTKDEKIYVGTHFGTQIAKRIFENLFEYGDLDFYRFKNSGDLNISKMSRVSGLSRRYLKHRLWQKGLI